MTSFHLQISRPCPHSSVATTPSHEELLLSAQLKARSTPPGRVRTHNLHHNAIRPADAHKRPDDDDPHVGPVQPPLPPRPRAVVRPVVNHPQVPRQHHRRGREAHPARQREDVAGRWGTPLATRNAAAATAATTAAALHPSHVARCTTPGPSRCRWAERASAGGGAHEDRRTLGRDVDVQAARADGRGRRARRRRRGLLQQRGPALPSEGGEATHRPQ